MAKATNKAASKKAAGKPTNKITLNLTKLKLNDDEKFELLGAVQKAVNAKLKDKSRDGSQGLTAPAKGASVSAAEPATITVDIRNTVPGRSDIRMEHNGVKKQLSQGEAIEFENVSPGDTIWIEGHSLGTVAFTIDRTARPQQVTFAPLAIIAFDFEILQ